MENNFPLRTGLGPEECYLGVYEVRTAIRGGSMERSCDSYGWDEKGREKKNSYSSAPRVWFRAGVNNRALVKKACVVRGRAPEPSGPEEPRRCRALGNIHRASTRKHSFPCCSLQRVNNMDGGEGGERGGGGSG